METLLITQAQKDALWHMGLIYVVADSEGVVYAAYASGKSAEVYVERFREVNDRPLSSHALNDCVASDVMESL